MITRPNENDYVVKPKELVSLNNHIESQLPIAYGPRLMLMSDDLISNADLFITSRKIDQLSEPAEPNVLPHKHTVSQTYLVFGSDDEQLDIEINLDGKPIKFQSPASVFIPAGMMHSIRVLRGSGTLISVVRSGQYF